MDLKGHLVTVLSRLRLPAGRALVAVSGGPDSVALLDLLVATRATHGLELLVAHADHGHSQAGHAPPSRRGAASLADLLVQSADQFHVQWVPGPVRHQVPAHVLT